MKYTFLVPEYIIKTKIKLFLSFSIIATFSFSQNNNSNDDLLKGQQTYVSELHNYCIGYPENWTVVKQPGYNRTFFIAPTTSSETLSETGAFMIRVFALPEALTSDYTYEKNMESIKNDTKFKDFKIHSKTEILISGMKAVRVVFSTDGLGLKTVSLQYYLAIGKLLFVMGGSNAAETLGIYESIFDEMIKSMKFKEN